MVRFAGKAGPGWHSASNCGQAHLQLARIVAQSEGEMGRGGPLDAVQRHFEDLPKDATCQVRQMWNTCVIRAIMLMMNFMRMNVWLTRTWYIGHSTQLGLSCHMQGVRWNGMRTADCARSDPAVAASVWAAVPASRLN